MNKFSRLCATTALAVAAFGTASLAHASLISIGLQQAGVNGGGITTVATDNGTGSTGVTSYSYGSFTVNNITALGSPATPYGSFQTASANVSSSAGGTLYIYITEQGLTSPTGLTSFLSGFTSNNMTGNPTITEYTGYSNNNAIYAGTVLAQHTFTSGDQTSSTNLATLTGPYSETVLYVITAAGASTSNNTINLSSTAVTPEPSSLALLGTGLVGAASMALRRRKLMA